MAVFLLKKKINFADSKMPYTFVYMKDETRNIVLPVRVTKEINDGLKEIADRRNFSVSLLVHTVLKAYVKKNSKKQLK